MYVLPLSISIAIQTSNCDTYKDQPPSTILAASARSGTAQLCFTAVLPRGNTDTLCLCRMKSKRW